MKKYHPTLEQVKATNPASITTHKKYSCSDIIIGKGSFGQVFLGWTKVCVEQVSDMPLPLIESHRNLRGRGGNAMMVMGQGR